MVYISFLEGWEMTRFECFLIYRKMEKWKIGEINQNIILFNVKWGVAF